MKRVALFRFHSINYDDIIARVNFFKKVNPSVEVYGNFGGNNLLFCDVEEKLKDLFINITHIIDKNKEQTWRNADIIYQKWYNEVGTDIDFDFFHPIEWDLILMDNLDSIYSNIPSSSLGCTGVVPLKLIYDSWYWTSDTKRRSEFEELIKYATKFFKYDGSPFAIQGPAICIPRAFLAKIKSFEIPRICNDEIRIPLYAQIFGFKIVDNGFFKWGNDKHTTIFNCRKKSININTIKEECMKINGYRVFHPYTNRFIFRDFNNILNDIPNKM